MISHLFCADDALFVGEWSKTNLKNLERILKFFGFEGKLSKIRVFGTGAPTGETSQWANILGCEAGSLPFTYLGIPVGANMNLVKN